MSQANDQSYYAARAQAELRLAESASDASVAAIHNALAEQYQRRANEQVSRPLTVPAENEGARA